MTELVIFRVVPVSDPMVEIDHVELSNDGYSISANRDKLPKRARVNWWQRKVTSLSREFNKQVKNNLLDLVEVEEKCNSERKRSELLFYERCEKFGLRLEAYYDTLQSDQLVLNQADFDVKTHAVVVTHKGQYQGHIYTWVSPEDPTICLAQRIRGRIDSLFLHNKRRLANVTRYLLEGVRMFALQYGCTEIDVVTPLENMMLILEKYGLFPSELRPQVVGASVAFGAENFEDLKYAPDDYAESFRLETYVLSNLLTPFIAPGSCSIIIASE